MASPVLIYDGACPICRGGVRWVERRSRPGSFEYLPCQAPARRARFPWMSKATCLEAMQLVLPDGRGLAGEAAIPETLECLRGWRWLAALFRLPGMGRLTPRLYRWVARHRYHFLSALSEDRSRTS
ncbi:MAG: thiol-disulfide oxidoreductase DCC family protein [Candidatus Methylomirabilia bacterium]